MIYFVRHGQTYDNANKILQGDGPLNELGVSQAKETGILLKDIKFDICFCSPWSILLPCVYPFISILTDLRIIVIYGSLTFFIT